MTTKKRGRPKGPAGLQRELLQNPPSHIKERVKARNGKRSEQQQLVLDDMDRQFAEVEAYRKSLRISHDDAAVLISSTVDVPQDVIDKVDRSVPSWRDLSVGAHEQKKESQQRWMLEVKQLLVKHANHTAIRAAELIRKNMIGDEKEKPSERTIRRYIGQLRK